ncbi:hypothetical protein [Streptomyces sp. NPDC056690]|uniref:hypothetical protein n=1 Tax=unclassified Streptomyces TaxID=2593676 RepID=UPI003628A7B1
MAIQLPLGQQEIQPQRHQRRGDSGQPRPTAPPVAGVAALGIGSGTGHVPSLGALTLGFSVASQTRASRSQIALPLEHVPFGHQNHAMDAGLAGLLGGVIGAAVGAVGATASAWITGRKAEHQAEIQSETQLRQARLQLNAEWTRALRESRKSAYLAFAESCHLVHGTLSEASLKLGGIAASDPPEEREERRQAARRLWNEARTMNRQLDRLQHIVFMEGPSEMGTAAQAATGALVTHFAAVIDWLHAVDNEAETPQHSAEQNRAHIEAYGKLLEFLYAAADTTLPDIRDR